MWTTRRFGRVAMAVCVVALVAMCLALATPAAGAVSAGDHARPASDPRVMQAFEPKATKAKAAATKAAAKVAPKKAPKKAAKTTKKAAKASAALQPEAPKKAAPKKAAPKEAAAKKAAAKKTTPKKSAHLPPAAERLSAAQQLAKYRRFQRIHPKRARGVEQDLAVFSRNRARVVALNDRFGKPSLPTPFRSTGPFMVLTQDDFKQRYLNTKPPTKRKQRGKPVKQPRARVLKGSPTVTVHKSGAKSPAQPRAPLAAAAKSAAERAKKTNAFVEVAARGGNTPAKKANPVRKDGGRVGAGGGVVDKSGQSGGNGRTVDKSGQSGGNGRTVDKSGQSGGNGHTVDKSGQSGGNGHTVDKSGQSGGNGQTVDKSGQSGGNGQTVDKSGQSGGNGQTVDKSGQSGGNGQGVDKSGQSGGNGGSADKSGQSGGNGGNVDKSGQSGGNGGDVDKSGQSGGNGGETDKSGQSGGNDQIHPDDMSGRRIRTITEGAGPEVVTRDVVIASLRSAGAHESLIQTKLASISKAREHMVVRGQSSFIKDQRFCGSCWAQTAASSVSMLHAQWYGSRLDKDRVSVQQLVDCVQTEMSRGCKGGTPMDAIDWMSSHDVATESEYPDRADGGAGECRAVLQRSPLRAWGWEPAVPVCEDANPMCKGQQLQELALLDMIMRSNYEEKTTIPILYVDASNWQSYSGGLFPVSLCSSTLEAGNHVVEVAGVGTDENGVPYWSLRNSWGWEWGEDGLIRIPFGVNGCGLANWAIVPSVPEDRLRVEEENMKAKAAEKLLRAGGGKVSDYDSNGRFKYDVNRAMWFDARTNRWTEDKPAEADERLRTLVRAQASGRTPELMQKMIEENLRRSRQDVGEEAVPAQELISIPPYDYSIKYDAGMYLDPETGGWTAVRPRHTPPNVGPGQTGGKYVSNSVQGRVRERAPGGRPTTPQPTQPPQPAPQPANNTPAKPAAEDFTAGGRYKYNAERDTWFDAQAGGWSMTKPAGADIRLKEQELAKLRRIL